MADLPTDTVTFLFTDIEGSTRLAQAHPGAMPSLLARHHAILRAATEAHSGYVFQITGDAFCAAFPTASDALYAALDARRGLLREVWDPVPPRVRMGLHTGAAQGRAIEDRMGGYTGYLTLTRAQRVMSSAHGGQVLLSSTSAELLHGILPEGVNLRDMGEHRLKGLLNPEHLWQMVADDLPQDFPPLQSLNAIPNNLPIQVTSFVGRERELSELQRLLATTRLLAEGSLHSAPQRGQLGVGSPQADDMADAPSVRPGAQAARLLTLTGSGGTGKTRLSLQVAAEVLDQYRDGIWFVELAPLADPTLLPQTVANVLGIREEPVRPMLATLIDWLQPKQLLLILDNCEHLIDACAKFADAVLHAGHETRILASSREPLGIAGESTYRVPSLACPNAAQAAHETFEQLTQYPAVRLFSERALQSLATFKVTSANALAVAQICYWLDGIPLAIELAATRVRAMRVEQIAARLDDRFHLLTGGSRTALPRQQTLRATMDWSYSLLSEAERVVLRRLSGFAGGWTLEAAEAVCAGDGIAATEILDLLTHLVDKSLVVSDAQAREPRYHMLETIRQYAREKLLESGEGDALRDRHLRFFAVFAGEVKVKLIGGEQARWLGRCEAEHDNLRAAIDWSSQRPDLTLRLRLPAALYMFWHIHGYHNEGLAALRHALARTGNEPWSEPLALARIDALITATQLLWGQDKLVDARPYAEEILALDQRLGDNPYRGRSYHALGIVALNAGDLFAARDWLLKSVAALQGPDDAIWLGEPLSHLGDEAYIRSDYPEAERWYTKCAAFTRQRGDRQMLAYPLRRLGYIAIQQGALDKAEAFIGESLSNNMDVNEMHGVIGCLAAMAAISLARAQPVRAVTLCGCVAARLEATHKNLFALDKQDYERCVSAARTQLGEPEFAAAWEAGRKLTLEQVLAQTSRVPAGAPETSTATPPQTAYPAGLTAREGEVLRLLAQGLTDAQIAETLVISPRTVNSHLRSIYSKLDVTTRTAAARYAAEFKLQ